MEPWPREISTQCVYGSGKRLAQCAPPAPTRGYTIPVTTSGAGRSQSSRTMHTVRLWCTGSRGRRTRYRFCAVARGGAYSALKGWQTAQAGGVQRACHRPPWRRTTMKMFRALLVAGGVAAACLWLMLGDGDGSNVSAGAAKGAATRASPMWRNLRSQAAAGALATGTRLSELRTFSVMRGAPEPMPAGTDLHIRSTVGAPSGSFELEDAQRLHTSDGSLTIVNGKGSGRGITCIVQGSRGYVGCTTTAEFAVHGLALGIAKSPGVPGGHPREFYVLGVAPDWVKSVELRIGAGRTQNVPVRGNAYTTGPAKAPVFVERFCRSDGGGCKRP